MCRLLGQLSQLSWKKAVPVVKKSCDSYHEKAVTAIMKKLSRCQEKLFALGSGCFQAVGKVFSTFTLWILTENGKISLKGISLFLVWQLVDGISTLNGWWYHSQPGVKCWIHYWGSAGNVSFSGVCVFGPRFHYNTFLVSNRRIGWRLKKL